jgi:hypothetical protein
MKIQFAIFVLLFCSIQAYPANIPSLQTNTGFSEQITIPAISLSVISNMKVKEVEKTIGRKLKLKEKIAFKIAQWKLKTVLKAGKQQDYKDKGRTAKLFGFISVASILLIPVAFLGILPCLAFGIAAIAVGKKAKKENPNDKNAKLGILLGWIGVGIISAATIFVIAFLISYSGGLR